MPRLTFAFAAALGLAAPFAPVAPVAAEEMALLMTCSATRVCDTNASCAPTLQTWRIMFSGDEDEPDRVYLFQYGQVFAGGLTYFDDSTGTASWREIGQMTTLQFFNAGDDAMGFSGTVTETDAVPPQAFFYTGACTEGH